MTSLNMSCIASFRLSGLKACGGYPNVAKAGGFQSPGAKGAAVVNLRQALGNAGSGALRLSRRVKKWLKIAPILKFTTGLFLVQQFNQLLVPYP
jgi:hypothetical protein